MAGFSKVNGQADKKGLLRSESHFLEPEWERLSQPSPVLFCFCHDVTKAACFSATLAALHFLCISHVK